MLEIDPGIQVKTVGQSQHYIWSDQRSDYQSKKRNIGRKRCERTNSLGDS